jgi:hypothetical protein
MLNSKTILSMITKEREAEIRTFISRYTSSYVLSRSDEIDVLAVFESALSGKTEEAIKLFEELETNPREIFARIILKEHQSNMKLAVNRITNIEINGEVYEIDYTQSKTPEISDLVVGRSDFKYDWETMSLVIQYGKVIEIWENGLGITRDGGYDQSLFMEESFILRKITKE